MSLSDYRASSHRRFNSLYATPVKKLLLSKEECVLKEDEGNEDDETLQDTVSLFSQSMSLKKFHSTSLSSLGFSRK